MSGVASSADGKSIILTGVTPTIAASKANTFAAEGVTVTVTATDKGNLFATNYLKVIVDDMPVTSTALKTSFVIAADSQATMVEIPLASYVSDPEGGTVAFFPGKGIARHKQLLDSNGKQRGRVGGHARNV